MRRMPPDVARALAAVGAVAAVTLVYARWLHLSNAATASTTFLLIVLVVAATSRLWVPAVTSIAAMFAFNYFFLPPVGGLTIADPQNWVAMVAFLVVSLIGSRLSGLARARAEEALSARDELARLFDLSRDVLLITEAQDALAAVARAIARRFELDFVGVALPASGEWRVSQSGASRIELDPTQLSTAFAAAQAALEFDAHARTYVGHRTMVVAGRTVRLVPLRVGTKPVGLLAAAGRDIRPWHARRAGWRRGHRHRESAAPGRSPGRRADAPERRAEDRAARVPRSRSADAAHRDPHRGQQPPGAVARVKRSAANRAI